MAFRLVNMSLDELQLIELQIKQPDHEMADLLNQHQDAVRRLAEVPGLGVDSAHQIIAEVGAAPSEKHLASWIEVCPGEEESAGVSAWITNFPPTKCRGFGQRSHRTDVPSEHTKSGRCGHALAATAIWRELASVAAGSDAIRSSIPSFFILYKRAL
jgi:transposase